jgi:4-amino-4-deoxy-L-arabinose transferase-like glycosyltransferase
MRSLRDWLGLALTLALALVALLGAGTLHLRASRTVEQIVPENGLAFAAPGVTGRPDGWSEESTLEIFEDGKRLGPPHAFMELPRGHGSYRQDPTRIVFSSSDGSDPRSNGRTYTLRYDWLPGRTLLAVLIVLAALTNARRIARATEALERAHPAKLACLVLLAALAFRAQIAWQERELTFGGHLVKGVPFSDARDWFTAASELSQNERSSAGWYWWSARRPFHYALLGAVFALTGPSLAVARVFNVMASALTAVVIFDLLRRISSRRVALLAALAQALLLYDARQDLSVMTEPLGNFLAALALWGFVLGAERGRSAWFVAGGVALGLSNLARPLTIASLAGLPLAFALVARRASVPWRRVLLGSGVFGLGFVASVGPWMLHQKLVYGIWTISENTAEAFYGATSPTYSGSWSTAVSQIASDRPIGERVTFFMEGTSRNIREHPGWYVQHVLENLSAAVRFSGPPAWTVVVAAAWWLALVVRSREPLNKRRALAVAGSLVTIVFALGPAPQLYGLALVGLAGALAARRPSALLAGFYATTLVSVSFLAMGGERRLTHSVEWISTALATGAVFAGLSWLEARTLPEVHLGDSPWGRAGRAVGLASVLVILLVLLGFARAFLVQPPPPRPAATLLPREPWLARALDEEARASFAPLLDRIVVQRTRVRPGFVIRFGADEKIAHLCPLFDARPYPFTVFEAEPGFETVFAGELPREAESGDLVLVGVPVARALHGDSFELLAVGLGSDPAVWLRPRGDLAREHRRVIEEALGAR